MMRKAVVEKQRFLGAREGRLVALLA